MHLHTPPMCTAVTFDCELLGVFTACEYATSGAICTAAWLEGVLNLLPAAATSCNETWLLLLQPPTDSKCVDTVRCIYFE
jgi:hypothetical protein